MTIQELENKVDLLLLIERDNKVIPLGDNKHRVNPCPVCNKKDHFTIFTETNSYSSFNDCCTGGSVYKYLMEVKGMNKSEASKELLSLAGEEGYKKSPITPKPTKAEVIEPIKNYIECIDKLYNKQTEEDKAYFIDRGFTNETIERFKLTVGNTKELGDSYGEVRAIIPYLEGTQAPYYNARSLSNTNSRKYKKPTGKSRIFGYDNLKSDTDYIFIVEGEINAISLEQLGHKTIASGGATNINKLVEAIEENKATNKTYILALDQDEAGKRGNEKLKARFEEKGITYITMELERTGEDINDLLRDDKDYINTITLLAIEKATRERSKTSKPHNTLDYLENTFNSEMNELSKHKYKSTGFKNIDNNSIFLPQLYVIGGLSSLGKTTFIHQMSDQLAGLGEHVLYFSLEMSRLELVSKSLARLTRIEDKDKATNSTDIRLKDIKKENIETLGKAINRYKEYAERISIIEGNFDTDVFTIRAYIEKYIKDNKVKPVVVIDYLQILKSVEGQADKQKIDTTVTELKRISRDFNISVIVVSSLNRSNYLTPIDFESFNGSGGIEYTADVVWGLQLQCIHEDIFNKATNVKEKRERINQCKGADIRKVEIVALKNRSGKSSYSCYFDYDCRHDLFIESNTDQVFHKQERKRL